MKKRKQNTDIDKELYGAFRDYYPEGEEAENAIKDAKKAFTLFRQDRLQRGGDQ